LSVRVADENDNDASSTSQESSDQVDPLESSECSYSSMDDIEVQSPAACDSFSSSLFSSDRTGEAKGSLVTKQLLTSQTSSVQHRINPSSPIDEHHGVDRDIPMHSQNVKHNVVPDPLELDYHRSNFLPSDRFLKNPFTNSFRNMYSADEVLLYTNNKSAKVEVSLDNLVYPFHSESGPPKLEKSKDYEESKINQPWNTSIPYNLNLNPILKNAVYRHTDNDIHGNRKNRALDSFDFESVTDPCEVYCGRSTPCLDESQSGSATVVQSNSQTSQQPDSSSKLAQSRSHADLAFSGEVAPRDNVQENRSGGALWEKSLEYTAKSKEKIVGDISSQSDMPLDIVIDKCIIQEVLLQYPDFFLLFLKYIFMFHARSFCC
jgi:gamma-tubulin complex component 6